MKTTIFISVIIVILAYFGLGEAIGQWSLSGNNIFNTNTGNVGIGTNTPGSLLYVTKNITEPTITIHNLGGIGGATYTMTDDVSGAYWKFKATNLGGFKIRDHTNGLDVIMIDPNSFANAIYIKNTGGLGIGTATPGNSALIDMSSTTKGFLPPRMTQAQIGSISSPANGLVVFSTTNEKFYVYIASAGTWKVNVFGSGTITPLPPFSCSSSITITHAAGAVAPVSKTVTYGTVLTNLTGSNKCWITQNLGADNQAASFTDATEASAGWYWQFNRQQGYKHDGTTRTPNTTWISSINENSDWLAANDPCNLELGSGWRLPTSTEWTNVIANGGWTWAGWSGPWNSVLKMHAAGDLDLGGSLDWRGSYGDYWSNTQGDNSNSWLMEIGIDINSTMFNYPKAYGFAVRCIQAPSQVPCGSSITIGHYAGNVVPVNKTVNYGTVTNIPGETSKCWITSNLGADRQATAVNDATEASAGWYWQFNRQQGYKHDGTTRTPNTNWINNINESSAWLAANDPCALELSNGWRLPTSTEWTNVIAGGVWTDWNGLWNSALKLHAAGFLAETNGSLVYRGSRGTYWSRTQYNNSDGRYLFFDSGDCNIYFNSKAFGFNLRCIQAPPFSCGSPITIDHVAGNVAPINKSVTYGTVTNIPGEPSKCWITSNLGADHQATAVDDATEASAGWYWQFNRMQGYMHDGTTRTPNTPWIASIDENSDWIAANDPCTIELGYGWRLPTFTEWDNLGTTGGWTDWNGPWGIALKLHAAGYLDQNGILNVRGSNGYYWCSTQHSSFTGWILYFYSNGASMEYPIKAVGNSIRCVR